MLCLFFVAICLFELSIEIFLAIHFLVSFDALFYFLWNVLFGSRFCRYFVLVICFWSFCSLFWSQLIALFCSFFGMIVLLVILYLILVINSASRSSHFGFSKMLSLLFTGSSSCSYLKVPYHMWQAFLVVVVAYPLVILRSLFFIIWYLVLNVSSLIHFILLFWKSLWESIFLSFLFVPSQLVALFDRYLEQPFF